MDLYSDDVVNDFPVIIIRIRSYRVHACVVDVPASQVCEILVL